MKKRLWRFFGVAASVLLLSACGSDSGGLTSSESGTSLQSAVVKQSVTASATTEQVYSVLRLIQGMFNASPGNAYLNVFSGSLVNGMTIEALAIYLCSTNEFKTSSLYPDTLQAQQFAERFIDNMLGTTVDATSRTWAIEEIKARLSSGMSRGEAIWWAVSALSSVPASDPVWGRASSQFANRVEVSHYYAVTKGMASSDLAVLQAVTAQVTYDTATVTAAKSRIDAATSTGSIKVTW